MCCAYICMMLAGYAVILQLFEHMFSCVADTDALQAEKLLFWGVRSTADAPFLTVVLLHNKN